MTWSEKVKQRDGMKCVVCGSEEALQAHHIKPSFLYPENQYDVSNGVTLCKVCHQRQHGRNFAGNGIQPINGIDPDPEGRMEEYMEKQRQRCAKRRKWI